MLERPPVMGASSKSKHSSIVNQVTANIHPDTISAALAALKDEDITALKDQAKHIDSPDALLNFMNQFQFVCDIYGFKCKRTLFYVLSLLDSVARSHTKLIVPWTETIIDMFLKALSSNSANPPSLTLQIYCSRIVSSLVNPAANSGCVSRAEAIIRSISGILLNFILGNGVALSTASAICFRALVGTDAWKYAPDDLVNGIYLRIAVALREKHAQTPFHLNLVCCLIKVSGLKAKPCMSSLLNSAQTILLDVSGTDSISAERKFCAIEMVNCILKYTDVVVLSSDVYNCLRIIKSISCLNRCPVATRDIAAETVRNFRISISEFGFSWDEGSFLEGDEKEKQMRWMISFASESWVPSYPPYDPHLCIGSCCLRLGDNSISNPPSLIDHPPEIHTCRNILELVSRTRVSNGKLFHGGDSNRRNTQSESQFRVGSSLSTRLAEPPVYKTAAVVGILRRLREVGMTRERWGGGRILGGLFVAGFAACTAMAVLKASSDSTD